MYEYRECYYVVLADGNEREKIQRVTTDHVLSAMERYESSVRAFTHGRVCAFWDTLSVEVTRISGDGKRTQIATAKLYADDFAE